MKRKCRILSIFVVTVLAAIVLVCVIKTLTKSKKEQIYAEAITFTTDISSMEVCIDNELMVDKSMVQVLPSNCTQKVEFTIMKSSVGVENVIVGNKVSFNDIGKHILTCKIKANKDYYIKDTINITVVETPTSTTSMYIKKLTSKTLYVEDRVLLSSLVDIKCPSLAKIEPNCSEHFMYENGYITAINNGVGTIDIKVIYNNLIIFESVSFVVKPKIIESEIDLILSVDGTVVENNIIETQYSPFNLAINYQLTKTEQNQTINCWCNSSVVEVVSYNSPIIELKILTTGTATIYVSPADYPNIIFEIIVTIV